MKKFPKMLRVRIEKDGDNSYLIPEDFNESISGENDEQVAVYRLESVYTLKIKRTLE